ELHPIQMNKLLKVLEDRKVFLESAYYSSEDPNVPQHIHDIFQNGLPADFRLVGATTRMPHEIPPAIRSRCLEIFFRPLTAEELGLIALNAAAKISFSLEDGALQAIRNYAGNGREAVNIIQISAGLAWDRKEDGIKAGDVEWVINASQISRRPEKRVPTVPHVGYVNGLAVFGPNQGTVVEIEVCTLHVGNIGGSINVTGMVEEEEIGGPGRTVRRKSSAKGSVENVVTVLRHCQSLDPRDYDIHVNFPGGVPIDGPSAGVAIATAVYSAITGTPVRHGVAMTGELSIRGTIRPVGGVPAKIRAAREAGAHTVLIPKENWQEIYADGAMGIQVVPVYSLDEVLDRTLCSSEESAGKAPLEKNMPVVLSAAGVSKKQVVLN
ncbi:MAG: ATP-dependent protease LonB, partial [Firmicutes bacterium]|nr:ATP-dependent protease LonB [Bacillota bacterium]